MQSYPQSVSDACCTATWHNLVDARHLAPGPNSLNDRTFETLATNSYGLRSLQFLRFHITATRKYNVCQQAQDIHSIRVDGKSSYKRSDVRPLTFDASPLWPEARSICHICHMGNTALLLKSTWMHSVWMQFHTLRWQSLKHDLQSCNVGCSNYTIHLNPQGY